MFCKKTVLAIFGALMFCQAAHADDLNLHCIWTIDGIDHVAVAKFKHQEDGKVYVDLVSDGRRCPGYSDPDLTHPGRQYFVPACGDLDSHFWVYHLSTKTWTMSRPVRSFGSASYSCTIE